MRISDWSSDVCSSDLRRIELDEKGRILSVAPRERLDAHKLIEDYMIAANVAAAKALEAKRAPVMYRVHEPPSREKLVALKAYLKKIGRASCRERVCPYV